MWRPGADSIAIFPDSAEVDPTTNRWKAVHYDTARVYRVAVSGPTGPYTMWIERTGTVAGIEYPLGTRWMRTDFNLAVSDFRRGIAADRSTLLRGIPDISAYVTSPARLDTATNARAYHVTRRSGAAIEPGSLAALRGGRQRASDSHITIDPATFTDAGSNAEGGDPFIQTDDPLVRALGAPRWQDSTTTTTVRRLLDSVHVRVTLDTSFDAATDAAGALRTSRARPDGLVRLFVALARHSGMRARYVVGFAPTATGVATHSWAEVLMAREGWVAIDPVLGRARASTNLIRLGYSGSSHPDDMVIALADVRLTAIAAPGSP